jgi:mono/diheme cytochrome c family protein
MLTRILALSALFVTVSASYPAFAQETGVPAKGLIHARQVCAQCHAIRQGDKRSPNPLAPGFEAIANTSGVTGMSLAASLHSTHENMPNFVLSVTDRNNVIAYILSLRRERQGMVRKIN